MKTNVPTKSSSPTVVRHMAKTTIRQDTCNYCTRPANTQIMANNAVYCGKLCAAFGLIAEVHKEDVIVCDLIEIWAPPILETICHEGPEEEIAVPIVVPVKVRWSDAVDVEELYASAPKGINYAVVSIDDEGTPDWIPPQGKQWIKAECEHPIIRVEGGGWLYCNAPRGHEGRHAYTLETSPEPEMATA